MKRFATTHGLAGTAARHPWLTILLWVAILGAAIVLAGNLGNVLSDDNEASGSSEAARAQRLIEQRLRANEPPREFVVVEAQAGVERDALDRFVGSLAADLRSLDAVHTVASHLVGIPAS